jgi:L-asparaginase
MRIGLFATGGTIGMAASADGPGVVPQHGADALAAGISTPDGVRIERHDLFAKPSASITLADVQSIADRIEQGFADGLAGAVVTHGTDTLEETAFALSLMLARTRPVVITGAMRSAGEVGADGPANLNAAIAVAASPEAHGQGPLVLFGSEIHAAHLVRKVHSSRLHAFSSEPYGPVGQLTEGGVRIELRALFRPSILRLGGTVPAVPILQVGLDLEPETIDAFAGAEIGGLIVAGVGGGHVASRAADALERLNRRVPVVLTTRVGMGETLRASYGYPGSETDLGRRGILNGGRWRPNQARILLQILLSDNADRERIAVSLSG